ncbi:MAG: hypothetical protein K2X28_08985 [Alphaproteobacteria bacterium]|nr:hypothetical protein [Alphaproteobacteria bacterium]
MKTPIRCFGGKPGQKFYADYHDYEDRGSQRGLPLNFNARGHQAQSIAIIRCNRT